MTAVTANTSCGKDIIRIEKLVRSFGNRLALRGVDLAVKEGEFVVIFGPNGAGKTTLIKILATIIKQSSGNIILNGLSLKDNLETLRRQIGVVTHNTYLYSNLTAYENLEFYGRMYDVPSRRDRIRDVLALVGMSARAHDRVGTLSRGMQQRLSIARSLLHRPGIMLLDEPETGLDQESLAMLWNILRGDSEAKRTIVLTTHNMERGLKLGERLLILANGKIAFEASTMSLDLTNLKEIYQDKTKVCV